MAHGLYKIAKADKEARDAKLAEARQHAGRQPGAPACDAKSRKVGVSSLDRAAAEADRIKRDFGWVPEQSSAGMKAGPTSYGREDLFGDLWGRDSQAPSGHGGAAGLDAQGWAGGGDDDDGDYKAGAGWVGGNSGYVDDGAVP